MLALAILGGCADSPRATLVEPSVVWAGESIRVFGSGFDADTGLSLTRPGDSVALPIADVRSTTILAGVPPDIGGGEWDVSVGDDAAGLPLLVRVDHPCAGDFSVNTQVSVARKLVVLDRYFPDGERESVSLTFGDISRVEVESDPGCSAVFLRRSEGGRLLYSDYASRDLVPRSSALASWIGRPLVENPRGL
jgi:hypothetical protein